MLLLFKLLFSYSYRLVGTPDPPIRVDSRMIISFEKISKINVLFINRIVRCNSLTDVLLDINSLLLSTIFNIYF